MEKQNVCDKTPHSVSLWGVWLRAVFANAVSDSAQWWSILDFLKKFENILKNKHMDGGP